MMDLSYISGDEPWTLWTKELSVLELNQKQTDGLYTDAKITTTISSRMSGEGALASGIDRNQYRAVLQRMNQAAHKVGSFTNWENSHT